MLSFGDEFELVAHGDTEVEVPGYSDEPYLRIGSDGLVAGGLPAVHRFHEPQTAPAVR